MAHSWSLLAFLSALLHVSHTTEYGSPQGQKKLTSLADSLQHPLHEVQSHGYSRDYRGLSNSKDTAGLRSQRALPLLAKPEEDRTQPKSLNPVGLETGPGRDRDRHRLGVRSTTLAQENYLMGTHKGRRQGHQNWHGHQFEHKKQGHQNDKRRHGIGKSSGSYQNSLTYTHTNKWRCI